MSQKESIENVASCLFDGFEKNSKEVEEPTARETRKKLYITLYICFCLVSLVITAPLLNKDIF